MNGSDILIDGTDLGSRLRLSTPLGGELTTGDLPVGQTIWHVVGARDVPIDRLPVVCVLNGEPLLRANWDHVLVATDELVFIVMPRGGNSGGGVKGILRLVALLALAVIAPYAAGALAGALGITSALGIALIQAGVVLAGAFLINALLPPQTASSNAQSTESSPTYSLSAQGNSARLLQPIPRLYGRHVLYPDFATQPYAEYQDNEQYLYQVFCLGVGTYSVEQVRIEDTVLWSSSGGYSGSFDDVQLQFVQPGETVTLVPEEVLNSSEVGGQELNDPSDWTGPYSAVPAGRQASKLGVDVLFPGGLGYANDNGGLDNLSVTVEVQARQLEAYGSTPVGDWVTLGTHTYTRATATVQRFTQLYSVSEGRYEVRVRRTEAKNTATRYLNTVQWGGLRAYIYSTSTYDDVTLLAVKMRATDQLTQSSSRRFNVIMTGLIPVWNGSSWSSPQASANPAWIIADMLRNSVYGGGLQDSRIDLDKLLVLSSTWASRDDTFNAVFDTKRSLWEAIGLVARAGRAQPIMVAGVVTFVRDEPRALARGVFTPRNTVKNSFESTHVLYDEDSPDDVIVEFVDDRTWEQNEVQCTLPSSTSDAPARIQLFGVTDRSQAWREGIYQAASNAYRRIFAKLTSEMEGRLLIKGDPVVVSHDVPEWAQSGDVSARTGRLLSLGQPVEFASSGSHYLVLRRRDGREFGPVLCTRVSDYEVLLDADDLAASEAAAGVTLDDVIVIDNASEPPLFAFGRGEEELRRFILVSGTARGIDQMELVMVNDDARVYAADAGSPPSELDYVGPGTVPGMPTVTFLNVVRDPNSPASPVLVFASWPAAAGANYYVLQASYDNVSWFALYEGTNTSTQVSVQGGTVYFRVAGVGTLRGPWALFSGSFGSSTAAPSTVTGLSASVSASNDSIETSWTAGARASSYRVEVYAESSPGSGTYDLLKLSRTLSGTVTQFTSSDILAAGGPWPAVRLKVYSINAAGESSPAQYTLTGYTLAPISGLGLVTPYVGSDLQVQWSSVSGATQYGVDVRANGVLVRSFTVTSPSVLYTLAQMSADGGPWRALQFQVQAQNGAVVSAVATLGVSIGDLQHFWRFNGSGADSQGSTALTLSGGASIVTDGVRGQVLSVLGDDERGSTSATLTTSYTKAMWINANSLTGGEQYLMASAATSDERHALGLIDDALLAGHDGTFTAVGATLSTAGAWYHVALTYDATSQAMRLYVNGTLASSATVSPMSSSPAGLQVSGYQGASLAFDGLIDDVQLYSRALTGAEVQAIMR